MDSEPTVDPLERVVGFRKMLTTLTDSAAVTVLATHEGWTLFRRNAAPLDVILHHDRWDTYQNIGVPVDKYLSMLRYKSDSPFGMKLPSGEESVPSGPLVALFHAGAAEWVRGLDSTDDPLPPLSIQDQVDLVTLRMNYGAGKEDN